MRRAVRTLAEHLLVDGGLTRLSARLRGGRTLILGYHNVIRGREALEGNRSAHLDFDDFRRQLDLIQSYGQVRPLETVLHPDEPSETPAYVLTFDDAYRGAVRNALPELRSRGLPATVFVAPGLLGTDGFWWDVVPVPPWEHPAPLGTLRGEDHAVKRWALGAGMRLRVVPPSMRACDPDELESEVAGSSITLGCHTWSHPNLGRLGDEEVANEVLRALEWLRAGASRWIPWIAYPYGLSSEAVRRVASRLGLEGGVRITGGWLPRSVHDPMDLPRLNVPAGMTERGFLLRLAGLRAE